MVLKFFSNIKKYNRGLTAQAGITLVEIVIVLFIIAVFSMIFISDFPKILRQMALSRATYQLAQDLRKTEDLGLSGVTINDSKGNPIAVKGYGIYINTSNQPAEKYVIYADVPGAQDADGIRTSDQKYSGDPYIYCVSPEYANTDETTDCVVDVVDVSKEDSSLFIGGISSNISTSFTSINFSPPDPIVRIDKLSSGTGVTITLENADRATRTVLVNKSGLINVQ